MNNVSSANQSCVCLVTCGRPKKCPTCGQEKQRGGGSPGGGQGASSSSYASTASSRGKTKGAKGGKGSSSKGGRRGAQETRPPAVNKKMKLK